jgi:hypothetical protein
MDVTISPNPTDALLTFKSATTIEKIEVYSVIGELVLSMDANDVVFELDITGLDAGMYNVNVYGSAGVQTSRVIKN